MSNRSKHPIGGKPPWYYDKKSSKNKYVKFKRKKPKIKTRHISKKI